MTTELIRRATANPRQEPAVHLASLTKRYGTTLAVDDLDLSVHAGEVFGLLGPNGAGKTSTLEMIAGLRKPTHGTVRVLGVDATADRRAVRHLLSLQPQQTQLLPYLTVRETLGLWASFYAEPRDVDELLAAIRLEGSAKTQVRKLSGGQERRLLLATALIGRPGIAILDEPSTGLDPNARADLWELLLRFRDDGDRTVVLSTHSMEEAQTLCDRVVIIDHGRPVAEGTPAELITRHAPYQVVSFARDGTTSDGLRDGPGVVSVETRGNRVNVSTTDSDALLARLRADDPRDLSVRSPGLEDVYRELTGRAFSPQPDDTGRNT